MTLALLLDTSTDYAVCGVARLEEGGAAELLAGAAERHERMLSARLYALLERCLRAAGLEREALGGFAVGAGPGSFTGVRVAVTTMRTLAQVRAAPLVAVSTLEALAWSGRPRMPSGDYAAPVLALLPSRRDEVYAAEFAPAGGGRVPLADPAGAAPRAASYAEARARAEWLLSRGGGVAAPARLLEALDAAGVAEAPLAAAASVAAVDAPTPASLAALAAREWALGRWRDPLALEPLYVVPPAVSQHKGAGGAGAG